MASKLALDPRVDPRIKAVFATFELPRPTSVASREELLAEEATNSAIARAEGMKAFLDAMDTEEIAPSAGLTVRTERFTSSPDGNSVNIQFIRPTGGKSLPCVYYIHGGGMATMSCYYGNYRAWGRMIAAQGVAVAMVDFRNAVRASTAPEVAPYPAGLNDCVSGLKWVHANAEKLGIDTGRVIIAGESGGGNLTLATGLKLTQGRRHRPCPRPLRSLPLHRGRMAVAAKSFLIENEGILISVHHNRGAMGYGIEAFRARDPLAWPSFAKERTSRACRRW